MSTSLLSMASSQLTLDDLRLQHLSDDYPQGSKPVYSYHTLVRAALLDAAACTLRSTEVIEAIESKFPYFQTERAQICKTYILNTLANTPCFSSGRGPRNDELYWTYESSKDHHLPLALTATSSLTTTSTTTLEVSQAPLLLPDQAQSDSWKEFDFVSSYDSTEMGAYPEAGLGRRLRPRATSRDSDELSGIMLEKVEVVAGMHVDLTSDTMKMSKAKRSKGWIGGYHDHGCCVIA